MAYGKGSRVGGFESAPEPVVVAQTPRSGSEARGGLRRAAFIPRLSRLKYIINSGHVADMPTGGK